MKNYKIVLTSIAIITVFLISCVSKNKKLIIGKWESGFKDNIEYRKKLFREDKNYKPEWFDTTDPNRKGRIIWEFYDDKTVRRARFSTFETDNEYGTYELVNGDKFIKFKSKRSKLSIPAEIVALTNNKLKFFFFNGDTLDLSKVVK